MTTRNMGKSVIEYGIQTATSKSILVITSDLADAQRTLDMIGDGRLVCRTVTYSRWQHVDEDTSAQSYSMTRPAIT
jgi:hypothetical protein